jgi:hypothetical protein
MKKAGLIIFAIGIIVTIFTGLNYTTKEVVLNSGNMNLTRDVEHGFSWSPVIGIIIMLIGVAIFVRAYSLQKKSTGRA